MILLTKHDGDLKEKLKQHRIENLFDKVIHIEKGDHKYQYIKGNNAIFIDDSHRERRDVMEKLHIPAFAPDIIGSLIDDRKL